nr:hypothetical protein CFP56_26156 [Quercus suber]
MAKIGGCRGSGYRSIVEVVVEVVEELRLVVELDKGAQISGGGNLSGDRRWRWRERVGLVMFDGYARSVEVEIMVARLEATWLKDERCKGVVHEAWDMVSAGDPMDSKVSVLIDEVSHSWNSALIKTEFLAHEADLILDIPLSCQSIPDEHV